MGFEIEAMLMHCLENLQLAFPTLGIESARPVPHQTDQGLPDAEGPSRPLPHRAYQQLSAGDGTYTVANTYTLTSNWTSEQTCT